MKILHKILDCTDHTKWDRANKLLVKGTDEEMAAAEDWRPPQDKEKR